MVTQILTTEQVKKLFADAYHDAALSCDAGMVVVTEVLEMVRHEVLNGNPYNVWNHLNFSKYKDHHEKLQAFLLRLKNTYRQTLFDTLYNNVDEAFKRSATEGWKSWFENYVEAVIWWNELHHRLSSKQFSFPKDALPVVKDLSRLNQLILENRWIDAAPLLQMIIDHELIQPHQRGHLLALSAEIYLFHLFQNDEALKRLQEAEKLIPGASRLKRVFAEYYEKTGNAEACRKEIFEAIFNDSNDLDNYLTMGDTYRDAAVADVAEKWYRDAIGINFIDGSPYTRLIGIYGSQAMFAEKHNEIPSLLLAAESLSPDSEFNGLMYDGYRDAGSFYFANQKNQEALECYEKAINMHPGWVTAYADISYVLVAENRFDEAAKKIEKALKIDPGYYDGKLAQAWIEEQKSYDGPEKDKRKSTLKAIELYQECISLRPSIADNFYNTIGVLFGNIDDYRSSADFYKKAIDADPKTDAANTALYHCNLGYAYNKLSDYENAKASYRQAIDLDPADSLTYNKLGNIHFACSEFEEAKECYSRAIELKQDVAVYHENLGKANFELGKWQEAIDAYKNAIAIDPSAAGEKAYALIYDSMGVAYDKLQNTAESEKAFLKAIEIDPQDYIFHNRLGILYYQLNKNEEALKYFLNALQLGKGEAVLPGNVGLAYVRLEQWEQAGEFFKQALAVEPDNPFYLNYTGLCYYRREMYDEAIPYYSKAIEKDASEPVYYENLALCYNVLQRWEDVIEIYKKAITIKPTDKLYNLLGVAYYNLEQPLDAIDNYKKALDMGNSDVVLYHNLALAYDRADKTKEAEEYYLKVVEMEPNNWMYQNSIGIFYYIRKDYDSAIRHYNEAIKLSGGEEILFENLGLAYEEAGKPAKALETYQQALKVHPGNEVFMKKAAALKRIN
jgi:tetratricopeptide (TPR) repeat protein